MKKRRLVLVSAFILCGFLWLETNSFKLQDTPKLSLKSCLNLRGGNMVNSATHPKEQVKAKVGKSAISEPSKTKGSINSAVNVKVVKPRKSPLMAAKPAGQLGNISNQGDPPKGQRKISKNTRKAPNSTALIRVTRVKIGSFSYIASKQRYNNGLTAGKDVKSKEKMKRNVPPTLPKEYIEELATALKEVIQNARAKRGLAKSYRHVFEAVKNGLAQLVLISSECKQGLYGRSMWNRCEQMGVMVLVGPLNSTELGQAAGLANRGADGLPESYRETGMVAICAFGQESDGLRFLAAHVEKHYPEFLPLANETAALSAEHAQALATYRVEVEAERSRAAAKRLTTKRRGRVRPGGQHRRRRGGQSHVWRGPYSHVTRMRPRKNPRK